MYAQTPAPMQLPRADLPQIEKRKVSARPVVRKATVRRQGRQISPRLPIAGASADSRFRTAQQFLAALDQGRWLPGLLSAEYRDEVQNELANGTAALLRKGTLGRLSQGRTRLNGSYNYELVRGGGRPPLLLRLMALDKLVLIDGLAPSARPERLVFRRDTGLPTSEDRLFNTTRLLHLPALDESQQQIIGRRLVELFTGLDEPGRDIARLYTWFGPRMQNRLSTQADWDRLLQPNNLTNLRITPGKPGSPLLFFELWDRQGTRFAGLAASTCDDTQCLIDALGYFGPEASDQPLKKLFE